MDINVTVNYEMRRCFYQFATLQLAKLGVACPQNKDENLIDGFMMFNLYAP